MVHNTQNLVNIGSRTSVNANEIVMLVADINYTALHFADGQQLLVSYHLGKLHERLVDYPAFIRPNRNTIININHLEGFDMNTLKIMGQLIKVSRRRKEAIFDSLRIV